MRKGPWHWLRPALVWGCLLLPLSASYGQLQRVVHQPVLVSDSIGRIELAITDSFAVETWPMSNMLIESTVMLYQCSLPIMDHLIGMGRYELILERQGPTLTLRPREVLNKPLQVPGRVCREEVRYKVYMPVGFFRDTTDLWIYPERLPAEPLPVVKDTVPDTIPQPNQHER